MNELFVWATCMSSSHNDTVSYMTILNHRLDWADSFKLVNGLTTVSNWAFSNEVKQNDIG